MSLPTFSDLMASLQLSSTGDPGIEVRGQPSTVESSSAPSPPRSRSLSPTATCHHPPSNGLSPSIVISQFEPQSAHPSEHRGSKSLGRSSRFAPYLGATNSPIHPRRRSLTDAPPHVLKRETPDRASSASPRIHPNTLRDVSMNAARPTRPHKLVDIDTQSDVPTASFVPISSFVRRRTPQSSPTASTFPHRRRSISSQDTLSPVLLPTLLPGLTVSYPNAAELMDVSEMEDMRLPSSIDLPKPRSRHQGLRLSSYRSASHLHDGKRVSSI
ncbi:hypothetical protein JB92DRAFT_3141550 [Gautieria morchelliformis]|nr:hypothetical protein JB92DRAFT_3141550 [Gautieria morchelliformis]